MMGLFRRLHLNLPRFEDLFDLLFKTATFLGLFGSCSLSLLHFWALKKLFLDPATFLGLFENHSLKCYIFWYFFKDCSLNLPHFSDFLRIVLSGTF